MKGRDVLTVYAFDIDDDRIQRIWAIRNPDKLRPWADTSARPAGR